MHIAMIGQKGMPAIHGGVERHVHDLSVRLVEAGHIVDVYARSWYTKSEKNIIVEGVTNIHTFGVHTKHLDAITHTLTATIAAMRSDADILHYHGVGPSLLSFLPRIFTPKKKVITTFHSVDRKHAKWGIFARSILTLGEWAASTFAHQTIAVSKSIQAYANERFDADAVYIPNGVPLMTPVQSTDTLSSFGLSKKNYIIALSRLISHKGIHYLIAAYLQLAEEYPKLLKNKKLVIVGDGYYTDEYVQYLKDMAKQNKNIIFTGFQSGIALKELMSHAELYVHPSNNEGLPITVLEAMSYGLPALVSDIPEHKELITHSASLFTTKSVGSLKEKLIALIKNKDSQKESSQANRQTIKNGFTWDIVTKDIISLYTDTLHAEENNRATMKAKKLSVQ